MQIKKIYISCNKWFFFEIIIIRIISSKKILIKKMDLVVQMNTFFYFHTFLNLNYYLDRNIISDRNSTFIFKNFLNNYDVYYIAIYLLPLVHYK